MLSLSCRTMSKGLLKLDAIVAAWFIYLITVIWSAYNILDCQLTHFFMKLQQICRDFTRGKCSRSANECRFLHHSSVEDVAIVSVPHWNLCIIIIITINCLSKYNWEQFSLYLEQEHRLFLTDSHIWHFLTLKRYFGWFSFFLLCFCDRFAKISCVDSAIA